MEKLGIKTFDYDSALLAAVSAEASEGGESSDLAIEVPVGMNDGIYRIVFSYKGASIEFRKRIQDRCLGSIPTTAMIFQSSASLLIFWGPTMVS